MNMTPSNVSWNELERCFNLCNMFCPEQSDCVRAVTLQTNNEDEIVSVCGKNPIKIQCEASVDIRTKGDNDAVDDSASIKSDEHGRKLRLLLFEECNRSCEGCCNKDFELDKLPLCHSYKGYDLIMLTGGEPMLHPETILQAVGQIRQETDAPIILYTALTANKYALSEITNQINGITVTLHDSTDVKPFLEFDDFHINTRRHRQSYRLNIFKGVEIDIGDVKGKWKVKSDIEWIKDCPLPEDEVLMRFNNKII